MDERQQRTILALLTSYATARADLEDRTVAAVLRLVAAMVGKWYDPKALAGFHADAADIVGRGQRLASDLTGSYVDHTLHQMNVTPIRQPLAPVGEVRGVDPAVEWERPAKDFRRLRATGLSELAAQVEAEERASNLTRMDLRLAERQAARQRMEASSVTG